MRPPTILTSKLTTFPRTHAHFIRKTFEPRYGRRLSDEEVRDIRQNLVGYAQALLGIAHKLKGSRPVDTASDMSNPKTTKEPSAQRQ